MFILRNPKYMQYTPIVTTFLLDGANVGQLWKMWTTHTALGQNIYSWISVFAALFLWFNWYKVFTPHQKFAIISTWVGMALTVAVALSVFILS